MTLFLIVDSVQYTQFPLNGFHCLDGSYTWLSNMSGLDQTRCVRDCLWSEECTMLMYNPWEGMCVLGSQPCVLTEPHSQLMTQIFRQVEDPECLALKAVSELDSGSRLIKVKNGNSLARLDLDGNSYIGSSNTPGNNLGYFNFDGNDLGAEMTMFSWRCHPGAVWPGCHTQMESRSPPAPWCVVDGMVSRFTCWRYQPPPVISNIRCTSSDIPWFPGQLLWIFWYSCKNNQVIILKFHSILVITLPKRNGDATSQHDIAYIAHGKERCHRLQHVEVNNIGEE